MTDAETALRHTLGAVKSVLTLDDLRQVTSEWTTPVKAVLKVLEVESAVGSICSSRFGICLVPHAELPVGEKLNADILRAPPGLAWSYWAETYECLEDGWTLGTSAKLHKTAKEGPKEQAPTPSLLQRNERSGRGRPRRANQRPA